VKLLYFAWVRQKIGVGEETLTLPAGVVTLSGLAEFLAARGGGYGDVFGDTTRLRAAVNQTHAGFDAMLRDSDEVAFFPPMTGG